jgi:hypothetical protein
MIQDILGENKPGGYVPKITGHIEERIPDDFTGKALCALWDLLAGLFQDYLLSGMCTAVR